jgi:hypothetical protein
MPTALFYNFNAYPFPRNPSRHKEYTPLITAYGITPVGKVCKFYINAHVHLGGASRHSTS